MGVRLGGLAVLFVLAACSHSTRSAGTGSALGGARSATVSSRTWRHWVHWVVAADGWITNVDGRSVFTDQVDLRPGLHTVVVERDEKRPRSGVVAACGLSFQAQPGHRYRTVSEGKGAAWRATLHDEQGGVPVPCTLLRPAPLR